MGQGLQRPWLQFASVVISLVLAFSDGYNIKVVHKSTLHKYMIS